MAEPGETEAQRLPLPTPCPRGSATAPAPAPPLPGRVLLHPAPGLHPALPVPPLGRARAPSPVVGELLPHGLPTGDGDRSHVCSSPPWQLPRAGVGAAAPDKPPSRGDGDAGSGTPACSRALGALPASVSPPALRALLARLRRKRADNPSNAPSLAGHHRAPRGLEHGPPRPGGRRQPRSLRAAAPAHLPGPGSGMHGGGLRRRAAHHTLREQPPQAPQPPGTSPSPLSRTGRG